MREANLMEIIIYEEGVEAYSKGRISFSNLLMALWIALGTIACGFVNPLIAWGYLAFALIMIFLILRKVLCTNCYYYDKWCGMGWGKLSALLFKKGHIEGFITSKGQKLAPLTYGFLTLIPLILLVISIVQQVTVSKVVVLLLLLAISFYSGTVSRKSGCAACKMRSICPSSAVK